MTKLTSVVFIETVPDDRNNLDLKKDYLISAVIGKENMVGYEARI
jgi:hypothetical protein